LGERGADHGERGRGEPLVGGDGAEGGRCFHTGRVATAPGHGCLVQHTLAPIPTQGALLRLALLVEGVPLREWTLPTLLQ